tara:strand:+ start:1313 stop:1474 length:162 start_codon:yes stop_codon:yes gene_type:complete
MDKQEIIIFIDWISKNYTPDDGIGYWLPSNNNSADSITSEELLRLYIKYKLYG